ncbi:MAG: hypothetical protein FJ291_06955 [Planctomycetes bacterium]|nr:hypothetical protein [Planctomycetota bacterium]
MGAEAGRSDLGWLMEVHQALERALEAAGPLSPDPAVVAALSNSMAQVDRALAERQRECSARGEVPPPTQVGTELPEPVTDYASFLRMKDYLLSHYRGMLVAFSGGRVVAASKSADELFAEIDAMHLAADVSVEPVDDNAFEQPAVHEVTGIYRVR